MLLKADGFDEAILGVGRKRVVKTLLFIRMKDV